MIYLTPFVSLLFSFFLPWHFTVVLAAAIYSFRKKDQREVLILGTLIFAVHLIACVALDYGLSGIVSERMSALFGLPTKLFFYPIASLIPSSLFISTCYVIFEGRELVKRKPAKVVQKRRLKSERA